MVEKVTVRGGGQFDGAQLENAASEATLLELIKAVKGSGGSGAGGGGGAGASSKIQGLYNKLLGESTDSHKENTSALQSGTSAVKSFTSGVVSAAAAGIGTVFGLAATAGQGLIKFLLDGTDNFQKLSAVGAGFGGDLQAIAKAATGSGMSMEAFTALVSKNNMALVALSGNAQAGALKLGQVSKELTEGRIGDRLFDLGLTVTDINDYMGSYLEQQARLGGMSKKSTTELAQGAAIYAEELDKVTKLTGIQRKDLEKQANKLALDPVINKLMAGIDRSTEAGERQYQKGMANMAAAAEMGGDEYQQALKEIAAGVVKSDLAKAMTTLGNVSQDAARDVLTGKRDIVGFTNQVNATMGKSLETADAAQIQGNQYLYNAQKLVDTTKKFQNDANSEQGKQAAANKKTAGQIASLGSLFSKVYNQILNKVVGSDAFTKLMEFIDGIATQFAENKGSIFNLIDTLANGLGAAFDKMIAAFKSGGLVAALKTGFEEIFKLVGPIVSDLFKGLTGGKSKSGLQSKRDALSEQAQAADGGRLVSLERQIADIDAEIANIGSDAQPIDFFDKIKDSIKELFPILEPLTNVIKGIEWAMANWGTVLLGAGGTIAVIGGLALALGPVGAALSAILTPASLVLAAFGFAAGGLGFMFQGISKIIDSFVEGFKSVPGVLGQLAELDSNKLKGIASAMSDIAGALSKLAGGGILSSLFGTGGLPDFINSAKQLETINSDSIKNTVNAVGSIKSIVGVDLSKQADGVKAFADSINQLTKNVKELQVAMEKLAKTPGGAQAASAVGASASAGAGGGQPTTNASSERQEKLNTLIFELVEITKEVRDFNKDQVDAIRQRGSAMGGK